MSDIHVLPALSDNYIHLVTRNREAIAVDPGDEGPVLDRCSGDGLRLRGVLITHHHADHTGGVAALKAKTGCVVVGPHGRTVRDGEEFALGPFVFRAIATPGHTASHFVYRLNGDDALFTGDTLFTGGCGRVFESSPREMWKSLQRLMALPDRTKVYCAHEYTEENLRFALTVEPGNDALRDRYARVKSLLAAGNPAVPSTMGEEKATNPFLRVDQPEIRRTLGMSQSADHEVFAELRQRKNSF